MIQALVVDGSEARSAEAGARVAVIVNQTPFYGESGGQVGDTGAMFTARRGAEDRDPEDTQKKVGDLWVHLGRVERGRISVGDTVEMRVDGVRRGAIRANHSATHLLHEALRRRLGEHVTQKGSLVCPGAAALRHQPADAADRRRRARGRERGQRPPSGRTPRSRPD